MSRDELTFMFVRYRWPVRIAVLICLAILAWQGDGGQAW